MPEDLATVQGKPIGGIVRQIGGKDEFAAAPEFPANDNGTLSQNVKRPGVSFDLREEWGDELSAKAEDVLVPGDPGGVDLFLCLQPLQLG